MRCSSSELETTRSGTADATERMPAGRTAGRGAATAERERGRGGEVGSGIGVGLDGQRGIEDGRLGSGRRPADQVAERPARAGLDVTADAPVGQHTDRVRQRTGPTSAAASSDTMSAPNAAAVRLEKTRARGGDGGIRSSTSRKRSTAVAMAGEWKAAATGSSIDRMPSIDAVAAAWRS